MLTASTNIDYLSTLVRIQMTIRYLFPCVLSGQYIYIYIYIPTLYSSNLSRNEWTNVGCRSDFNFASSEEH